METLMFKTFYTLFVFIAHNESAHVNHIICDLLEKSLRALNTYTFT